MSQPLSAVTSNQVKSKAIPRRGRLRLLLISMRPHQWGKNLFVLAPLLFGQRLTDTTSIVQALLACAAFCLLSSSLYLINDVADAANDRMHPEKCHRPVASGALPISLALSGAVTLALAALGVAAALNRPCVLLAMFYGGLTLGYCLVWKHSIVLDGMIIASGFVLRVVGGAVAVGVVPTHWLIACAFLLALYLAFAKRRQELLMLSDSAWQHRQVLGEYTVSYLEQVNNILIGATIVCYTLYTVAPETVARFGTDSLIYGTVFVIYGLLRYLALTQNSAKGGNPGKLLMSDRPLLLAVAGWAMYNALIIYRAPLSTMWERLH
jgi:4-hydroxybenzoate polyprenyltransferase